MKIIYSAFVVIILAISITSCGIDDCIDGSLDSVERTLDIADIRSLELDVSATVLLTQGPVQEIVVRSSSIILDKLVNDSRISNGNWFINLEGCNTNVDLDIFITIPTIERIVIDGSGTVSSTNGFQNLENLSIEIDGSGEVDLNANVQNNTEIGINGSGKTSIAGRTNACRIDIDGSANVKHRNFQAQSVTVFLNGSGDCEVAAAVSLNAIIDGSGTICYIGTPELVTEVSGSGTIGECP